MPKKTKETTKHRHVLRPIAKHIERHGMLYGIILGAMFVGWIWWLFTATTDLPSMTLGVVGLIVSVALTILIWRLQDSSDHDASKLQKTIAKMSETQAKEALVQAIQDSSNRQFVSIRLRHALKVITKNDKYRLLVWIAYFGNPYSIIDVEQINDINRMGSKKRTDVVRAIALSLKRRAALVSELVDIELFDSWRGQVVEISGMIMASGSNLVDQLRYVPELWPRRQRDNWLDEDANTPDLWTVSFIWATSLIRDARIDGNAEKINASLGHAIQILKHFFQWYNWRAFPRTVILDEGTLQETKERITGFEQGFYRCPKRNERLVWALLDLIPELGAPQQFENSKNTWLPDGVSVPELLTIAICWSNKQSSDLVVAIIAALIHGGYRGDFFKSLLERCPVKYRDEMSHCVDLATGGTHNKPLSPYYLYPDDDPDDAESQILDLSGYTIDSDGNETELFEGGNEKYARDLALRRIVQSAINDRRALWPSGKTQVRADA